MKFAQHTAILFSLLLFITTISLAVSHQVTGSDWLLVYAPVSQAVSALEAGNGNMIPLDLLEVPNANDLRVSPNGTWLYFFDNQGTMWGLNLLTGDVKNVFHNPFGSLVTLRYISPDGGAMFFGTAAAIKRFDLDSASERLLDIDLTSQNGPAYVPQFEWLKGNQWVYVHTLSGWTYRISRDGTIVEPYNVLQTTLSPDGNWGWYQDRGEYFVKNLVDGSVFTVPGMDTYSGRVSGWTPDSSLIVQYVGNDRYIDFHNSRQPATTTVAKFQDGIWTIVSEDKFTFHESSGQVGAISPSHTHYVYFENDNILTIMDLRTEQITPIGAASQFYYWNHTGGWLVYVHPEDKDTLTVSCYDVDTGSSKPLFTFDWNGSSFGFYTIAGTDLFVLYWLDAGAAGDLLMDARTGQILELEPNVDVVSQWKPPAFPAPRWGLHVVFGLMLLAVGLMSGVVRRAYHDANSVPCTGIL